MIVQTALLCIPHFDDRAISAIRSLLREESPNFYIVREESVDSQRHWLEEILRRWCDEDELDLILTLGGTLPAPGPSVKEIVPDATCSVVDRFLPGISEAMRQYAGQETPMVYLDRGIAGIRGRTLIINLPAGAAPAYLFLEAIIDLLEPMILHLNEHPDAPQLANLLQLEVPGAGDEATHNTSMAITPAQPARGHGKSLNAAEFADYLRSHNPPDEQKSEA